MTLRLRPAGSGDSRLLYDFVSRPDSLANKRLTKRPIAWDEHDAWFKSRLTDPDCRIWVLTMASVSVGQLRLTRGADGWEIDIYIAEESRRRGAAEAAIGRAIELLRRDVGPVPVIARVMFHNCASRQLFEHLGFRLARRDADHFVYIY